MLRTHRAIVVAALLTVSASSFLPSCLADALSDYNQGVALHRESKRRAAIEEFSKVPDSSDLAAKACYGIAECYRELMDFGSALTACEKGLALASIPEDRALLSKLLAELRLARAQTFTKAGKWDEAISQLQGMTTGYPSEAGWLLATCQMKQGDYQAALDTLTSLVEGNPGDSMAVTYDASRARCLFFLGRETEAVGHLIAVIRGTGSANPDIVECASVIGDALISARRIGEGRAFYTSLIQAGPGHELVVAWRDRLAGVCYREHDWAAARDAYDAVCRDYPRGPWHISAEYMAAACSERLGQYEDAAQRFEALARDHTGVNEAQDVPRRLARLSELKKGGTLP